MKIQDLLSEGYGGYGSRNPDLMSPSDYDRYQQNQMDADRRAFKYAELQHELGHEEEPRYRSSRRSYYSAPKSKGMYFYNVPAGKENDAKAAGLRQSKSGKWYSTMANTWAEKAFGKGRYWEPKSESIEALEGKISQIKEKIAAIKEAATAGATSSGNIATIANPHLSPGKARGKKSFTGTPGKSGTKAPPQPKPADNTGKNGLDVKGVSIFGGPAAKR